MNLIPTRNEPAVSNFGIFVAWSWNCTADADVYRRGRISTRSCLEPPPAPLDPRPGRRTIVESKTRCGISATFGQYMLTGALKAYR